MARAAELTAIQGQLATIQKQALVAAVSQEQLWTRPSPESWSVGECLAHLNIVGQLYLSTMQAAVDAGWAEGRVGSGPFR